MTIARGQTGEGSLNGVAGDLDGAVERIGTSASQLDERATEASGSSLRRANLFTACSRADRRLLTNVIQALAMNDTPALGAGAIGDRLASDPTVARSTPRTGRSRQANPPARTDRSGPAIPILERIAWTAVLPIYVIMAIVITLVFANAALVNEFKHPGTDTDD